MDVPYRRNRRFPRISGRWMSDVSSEEYHWFVEHFRSDLGDENGIDSAQLDIDLQTDIGQRLGRRLVDIL